MGRERCGRVPDGCACAAALTAMLFGAAGSALAQTAEQLDYGRHLSNVCASCHIVSANDQALNHVGTADITGMAPPDFLAKLESKELSSNPVMRQVVSQLGPAEREALAVYLAQLRLE